MPIIQHAEQQQFPDSTGVFAAVCYLHMGGWVAHMRLMLDLCIWDVCLWCYLQIASRVSRVRLISRICVARLCMGCMERSNSSQRAISVYMPCGGKNMDDRIYQKRNNLYFKKNNVRGFPTVVLI